MFQIFSCEGLHRLVKLIPLYCWMEVGRGKVGVCVEYDRNVNLNSQLLNGNLLLQRPFIAVFAADGQIIFQHKWDS